MAGFFDSRLINEGIKMDKVEKRNTIIVAVIAVLILAFFAFLNHNEYTWEGEGYINVFPQSDQAKNYRLSSSSISVTENKRGWFHSEFSYSISGADWPDGGELDFDPSCKIDYPTKSATCESNSGTYVVEVAEAPSDPGSDSYDPNN